MKSFDEAVSYALNACYQPVVCITCLIVLRFAISEALVVFLRELSVSTFQKEFIILLLLVFFFALGLTSSKEWPTDAKGTKTPEDRKMRRMKDAASQGGCQARRHGQNLPHLARHAARGSASNGHDVCTTVGSLKGNSDEVPRTSSKLHWIAQFDSDAKIVDDVQREGFTFDASNHPAILAACARQSHAGVAIKLFKYMLETGIVWDQQTGMANRFFKVVAEGFDELCMREHGVELIEAIVAHRLVPTFLVQNRLICAWRSKPPHHVILSFMALREQGVGLSPTVYRCIIAAHERTEPRLTLDLYDEMVNRGIKIDRVGFNAALCACSHLGGMTSKAMELFDTMPYHRLVPNGKTYGTLIRVFAAAGMAQEAVGLFESMRAASIEPNRFTFDDAIHCYVKVNSLGKAVALYTEMVQSNVLPLGSTAHYLSRLCQKKGWTKIAQQILQDSAGGTSPQARGQSVRELDVIHCDWDAGASAAAAGAAGLACG